MVNFATVPLTYKEVWNNAFKIFSQTISKVWFLSLLLGITISGSNIAAIIYKNATLHFSMGFAIVVLAMFLVSVFLINLITYRIAVAGNTPPVTLLDATKFVGHKYFRLLLALLVISALTLAGIILFVIPGFILTFLLIFTQLFILFEDQQVWPALKSSACLVWKDWWRTFAVIGPIVGVDLLIGQGMSYLAKPHLLLAFGVSTLILSFYFPLLYAIMLVQYHDLKTRSALRVSMTTSSK